MIFQRELFTVKMNLLKFNDEMTYLKYKMTSIEIKTPFRLVPLKNANRYCSNFIDRAIKRITPIPQCMCIIVRIHTNHIQKPIKIVTMPKNKVTSYLF